MSAISNRINENENMEPQELRAFMELHGIAEGELADIFGVTRPGVKLWLSGARTISTTNTRLVRLFMKYPGLIREF